MEAARIAKLLRRAARDVSHGRHPNWEVVTGEIGRFRAANLPTLPDDIKVHILTLAFPHPFSFTAAALSHGKIFLQSSRAGMRAWVGEYAFREKQNLMTMLQCARPLADRIPRGTNAHIFITSRLTRARIAIGFWDGTLHGPCKFVDGPDADLLVELHRRGDTFHMGTHASIPATRYTRNTFPTGEFRVGITFDGRFRPIHVVEEAATERIIV